MLQRSVGEECRREVWEGSVRRVLQEVVQKCWREVPEKEAGKKCWRR